MSRTAGQMTPESGHAQPPTTPVSVLGTDGFDQVPEVSGSESSPRQRQSESFLRNSVSLRDSSTVEVGRRRMLLVLLLVIVGVLCLPPVFYVIREALSNEGEGLRQALDSPTLGRTLRTTVALTACSVVLSTVFGTFLAWGAQGLSRRLQWLGYVPLVPLLMPALAVVTGFGYLFNPRIGYANAVLRKLMFWSEAETGPLNVNTVPFMVAVTAILTTSFVYLFVRSALAELDQSVLDAAAVAGASPTRAFWTIVLPFLRPALVYSSLTVALLALGQFTVPLLFGRQDGINVLSTAMYSSTAMAPPNIPRATAFGIPIVLAGLIFIVAQRFALTDQSRYASTGTKGAGRSVERSGWLSQCALIAYGLVAVAAPLGAVAVVALQPSWSKDIVVSEFTLQNFRTVFGDTVLTDAIKNSVQYSLVATLLVVPLGYLCAKALSRRQHNRVLTNVVDVLVSLPLGIPAVIFGVGFLLAFSQGPLKLYGHASSMIVVCIVCTLPFVTRILLVALINQGDELVAAGAASGASLWRRTMALELPMLRTAVANAMAISLILASQEFGASLLVRSARTQVMGTVLYDRFVNGSNSEVAVMSFVMCVITGLCVLLALAIGRQPRAKNH